MASTAATTTGAYSFPSVPIGTYTVTFELSGFKKISRPEVILTTGFSAMIDGKMEVKPAISAGLVFLFGVGQ